MADGIRVTVWNEGRCEQLIPETKALYPEGMGHAIGNFLEKQPGIAHVGHAALDDPEQGLASEVLDQTDVLLWWGHKAHDEVTDSHVDRVQARVLGGMGLVVLHSGHYSRIFRRLMGTTCMLNWREWQGVGERERLWLVDPAHPIAEGIPPVFEIPHAEMYGEQFDVPPPEELIFLSWFQGGEVFRSGCTWRRGQGKIFYFRPGHETFPIFRHETVLRIIANGARWAAPTRLASPLERQNQEPREEIRE
jgi:trehalose utilization protein